MQANGLAISTALIGSAMLADPTPAQAPPPPSTASMPPASSPEAPAMPSLLWAGVNNVSVLCLVTLDPALTRRDTLSVRNKTRALLCERIVHIASKGAPHRVAEIAYADHAIQERDRLTLLLHARLQGKDVDRRLLYVIRPYRPGMEADVLFGVAPDTVPMVDGDTDHALLDGALTRSLAPLLPWQTPSRPDPLRPLFQPGENE